MAQSSHFEKRRQREPYPKEKRKGPKPGRMIKPIPKPVIKEPVVRNIELSGFHVLNSIMFAEAKMVCEKAYDHFSRGSDLRMQVLMQKDKALQIRIKLITAKKVYTADEVGYKVLKTLNDVIRKLKRQISTR